MSRPFLGILGSGKGSNLEAIYKAIQKGTLNAEIKVAISDVANCGFLQKAKRFQIPYFNLSGKAFDKQAIILLKQYQVDLVILAGFMRILGTTLLKTFPKRVLNIHPSLLPKFPGKEAWRQAWEAKENETGCTIHVVTEQIDQGPILARRKVIIFPTDSAESLRAKIQAQEHKLYPETIAHYWRQFNAY